MQRRYIFLGTAGFIISVKIFFKSTTMLIPSQYKWYKLLKWSHEINGLAFKGQAYLQTNILFKCTIVLSSNNEVELIAAENMVSSVIATASLTFLRGSYNPSVINDLLNSLSPLLIMAACLLNIKFKSLNSTELFLRSQ